MLAERGTKELLWLACTSLSKLCRDKVKTEKVIGGVWSSIVERAIAKLQHQGKNRCRKIQRILYTKTPIKKIYGDWYDFDGRCLMHATSRGFPATAQLVLFQFVLKQTKKVKFLTSYKEKRRMWLTTVAVRDFLYHFINHKSLVTIQ